MRCGLPAEAQDWGVLYLGSAHTRVPANGGGPLIALDRKGQPLADQAAARGRPEGLVALDGNWAQAKALWWRNAMADQAAPLRRSCPTARRSTATCASEARPDAVSTLEAVALALSVLKATPPCARSILAPFRDCWFRRPGPRASGAPKRDRSVRRR